MGQYLLKKQEGKSKVAPLKTVMIMIIIIIMIIAIIIVLIETINDHCDNSICLLV